jgi:hypothetical protein
MQNELDRDYIAPKVRPSQWNICKRVIQEERGEGTEYLRPCFLGLDKSCAGFELLEKVFE